MRERETLIAKIMNPKKMALINLLANCYEYPVVSTTITSLIFFCLILHIDALIMLSYLEIRTIKYTGRF